MVLGNEYVLFQLVLQSFLLFSLVIKIKFDWNDHRKNSLVFQEKGQEFPDLWLWKHYRQIIRWVFLQKKQEFHSSLVKNPHIIEVHSIFNNSSVTQI